MRDLSVTVLRAKEHCLAHGHSDMHRILALCVESSCLETLCVRAVVAEAGLLAHTHQLGLVAVRIDLQLTSLPELRQLLVCCHWVRVSRGQILASSNRDRPALRFSGLNAAFLTNAFGGKLTTGDHEWAFASELYRAKLQDMFQLCEMIDTGVYKQGCLNGSLRLASDSHTMQQLQMYFENGCYP